ncbi:unnamed protein product [Phytophthora lilii]|uniref:Unnamed protein product n=1 Tax=Phytophthora lilii TaxID=2077276 RepID=A0A9W6WVM4_9STRA|nr:unnamed protein product [Phytophthora lilii]
MSGTSYAAWQRFDVEQELARVDQAEQREERERQQRRREQAKQSVESSATLAAQQSADILAAQAAVAALKAKKKGRARAKRDEAAAEDKAAALQAQAALFAQKGALLQQIMESRRLGDKKLKEESWQEAKTLFETALKATKKLEDLAPELLKAEEEQAKLLGKEAEVSNQHAGEHECEHAEDAEHQCGNTCSHEEHKKKAAKKPDEPLPKANDLKAIIKMFYKDVYMGIGTCDLEEGKLAPATKAFKEVLLRDDVHLAAWLKRGEAFERMGAPLLAMLHFSRITNLVRCHPG